MPRRFDYKYLIHNNKHFIYCSMNIEERSIDYLERLLAMLAEIDQMSSPIKRLQAKMDLRMLFEEALHEGQESVNEKPYQIVRDLNLPDVQDQVSKDRPLYSASQFK